MLPTCLMKGGVCCHKDVFGKCRDKYPNCGFAKTLVEAPESPTPTGQVDLIVKRKISEEEFCMICPECGHHPLTLMGERKGLDMKLTGGKAQCPVCLYEMEL